MTVARSPWTSTSTCPAQEEILNLLSVLAALNRLYYSRFELKRMHTLISKMSVAPPQLADRLESLFRLQPSGAAEALEVLVTETHALVARRFRISNCTFRSRPDRDRDHGRSRPSRLGVRAARCPPRPIPRQWTTGVSYPRIRSNRHSYRDPAASDGQQPILTRSPVGPFMPFRGWRRRRATNPA